MQFRVAEIGVGYTKVVLKNLDATIGTGEQNIEFKALPGLFPENLKEGEIVEVEVRRHHE